MRHNIKIEGLAYRLRPVTTDDAQLIVDLRLEDKERNKYIHAISPDPAEQVKWLEDYYEREGDYYWVIENRFTGVGDGLISVYSIAGGRGEWGRWVTKQGSLATSESVLLLYHVAFKKLGLFELYCRTLSENKSVVSFHDSIGEQTRFVLPKYYEMNGTFYDATEQYSDRSNFESKIRPKLEKTAQKVFIRQLKKELVKFEFHHIGVASKNIASEYAAYQLLGYSLESDQFADANQGIDGLFIVAKGQPRLELLANAKDRHTLDKFLDQGVKLYHFAYIVGDFDRAVEVFERIGAKAVSNAKLSAYFGKRIAFYVLRNMFMIEIVEE